MHRELSRKGITLMLLWQEYQANFLGRRTLQYSQFCERYRQYVKTLKRSMRQVHRAGEKLFVDFTGPTLSLAKRHGRERLEVACAMALSLHSCYYRTVRDILANGRDRLAPSAGADWVSPQHEHLRGARSYH